MSGRRTLRDRLQRLGPEAAKFGAVGAIGFLVNAAVFNLCIHTLDLAPIRSSVIATAIAIVVTYVGNRHWTYRHRDKSRVRREAMLFLLFSGSGMVIESGILAISHYALDFTSPLADNLAKYVVGLALGSFFRFWSYRTWVFAAPKSAGATESEAAESEPAVPEAAVPGSRTTADPDPDPATDGARPVPAPGGARAPRPAAAATGQLRELADDLSEVSPGLVRLAAQKEGEYRRSLL